MSESAVFWEWIKTNQHVNADVLRLKYHSRHIEGIEDIGLAITQIECRQRYSKKLETTLADYPHWIFPNTLAAEQSTSDILAQYHASLIPVDARVADLTAGLGIDVLHIAKRASSVTGVELDCVRAKYLKENLSNVPNITIVEGDCREWIKNLPKDCFDVVFIDPARRSDDGSRIYAIADCKPDIISMLPDLKRIAQRLVVKLSPMLDIKSVANSLPCNTIIALGTARECRELIAICDFSEDNHDSVLIQSVTLPRDENGFSYYLGEQKSDAEILYPPISTNDIGIYIWQPNPSLVKVGASNVICERYSVKKVAKDTQLYIAPHTNDSFDGTTYKIVEVQPYTSATIKRFAKRCPAAEVWCRNFDGMSAPQLVNKLRIREKGPLRLYAVTDSSNNKYLILTEPI